MNISKLIYIRSLYIESVRMHIQLVTKDYYIDIEESNAAEHDYSYLLEELANLEDKGI